MGKRPHLADVVVLRVEELAEAGQQLGPLGELPLGGNGGDEDAHRGPDQGRAVPNAFQAFRLDEVSHLLGELLKVRLHIVLEDQATQGAGRLICAQGSQSGSGLPPLSPRVLPTDTSRITKPEGSTF